MSESKIIALVDAMSVEEQVSILAGKGSSVHQAQISIRASFGPTEDWIDDSPRLGLFALPLPPSTGPATSDLRGVVMRGLVRTDITTFQSLARGLERSSPRTR